MNLRCQATLSSWLRSRRRSLGRPAWHAGFSTNPRARTSSCSGTTRHRPAPANITTLSTLSSSNYERCTSLREENYKQCYKNCCVQQGIKSQAFTLCESILNSRRQVIFFYKLSWMKTS